jgi:hypothetical protein
VEPQYFSSRETRLSNGDRPPTENYDGRKSQSGKPENHHCDLVGHYGVFVAGTEAGTDATFSHFYCLYKQLLLRWLNLDAVVEGESPRTAKPQMVSGCARRSRSGVGSAQDTMKWS